MEIKRIVLGLDDSAAAANAARWAADAVSDSGGEVIAVHGVGVFPDLVRQASLSASAGLGMPRVSTKELVDEWCQPLRDGNVPYRTEVTDADPVHALLQTARRENADMIVIGHEGGTGLLHRLFSRLSDQIVDHARRPVVIVPFYPSDDALSAERR